jgi:hypothetical protein
MPLFYVHLAEESIEEQVSYKVRYVYFTQDQAWNKTTPCKYMIVSCSFGSIYWDASVQWEVWCHYKILRAEKVNLSEATTL